MTRLPLFGLLFTTLLTAAPPEVIKVEPPNWWINHTINPVRLLVRGRNLQGAAVVATSGLSVANAKVNTNGTYLFVDVTIPPATVPGPASLTVRTADGAAPLPFEVSRPLPSTGRFQGFSPNDIIYLIMPDRFSNGDPINDNPEISRGLYDRRKSRYYHGGDLQGVINRLPYLKQLGITAIWLNPIYDNVNHLNEREKYDNQGIADYHGYGAVDFYGVEEHLGTLATVKELVEAAHQVGIKVIQDQVANHTGPYHPWVQDPPTATWFNGTETNHLANTWQTWTLMDPHATPDLRKTTLDGWFIDILPDLNQRDPETRRYLIQNTLWWMGVTGFDGIRQDTWPYVPRDFWRDWMAALKKQYPTTRVVGEVFDADPAFVSFFEGGRKQFDGIDDGVDSLFDFPLYFKIRSAFAQGKSIRDVAIAFGHDRLYRDPNRLVTFLGLHDVSRFMSEEGATVEGLKLAFTLLMTTRGIPMIYYGDEIAMAGGGDPDNRRDFPGGWQEDKHDAFIEAGRNRSEQTVWNHVRRLTILRKEVEALRDGRLVNLSATEQGYVYARIGASETVLVAMNNDKQAAIVEAPVKLPDGTVLEDQLTSAQRIEVRNGLLRVSLPARSAAVMVVKR